MVTIRTTGFKVKKLYVLSTQCIYVSKRVLTPVICWRSADVSELCLLPTSDFLLTSWMYRHSDAHPNLNTGHVRKPSYQLGNKLPASYGHRMFIIVFTTVHHWAVIYTLTFYFFKTHFNIIFPSTSGYQYWSIHFGFCDNFACTSNLVHVCYVPCPPYVILLHDSCLPLPLGSPPCLFSASCVQTADGKISAPWIQSAVGWCRKYKTPLSVYDVSMRIEKLRYSSMYF